MWYYNLLPSFLILLTWVQPLVSSAAVEPSSFSSSSSGKLPGSVKSVMSDLEAEGVAQVATVALLSSRSVASADRVDILRSLLTENVDMESSTSALAGKSHAEQGGSEMGLALATPGFSVSETATAVQTCGGNLLFLVHVQDLQRGGSEGVFDLLAPAVDRWLSTTSDCTRAKWMVLFVGMAPGDTLAQMMQLFRQAAETCLYNPLPHHASSLQQLLTDRTYFGVARSDITTIQDMIQHVPTIWMDVPAAIAQITKSTSQIDLLSSTSKLLATSPTDLAAVRRLLPLSKQAFKLCIDTIAQAADLSLDSDDFTDMKPMEDFAQLADAAIQRSLDFYDQQAQSRSLSVDKSTLSRRIRSNLIQEMHSTIIRMYEAQLDQLYLASMDSFKAGLSKLRISPNLGSDMNKVAKVTIQSFLTATKKIFPKALSSTTLAIPSTSLLVDKLANELSEFISLRLLAARADGKFRPLPRKGLTVGLHWLLPKPFGNDYRQEPWMVHTKDDLIFVPKDKITDVAKEDIMGTSGEDWTSKIIPCPTANEMIYMK